MLSYLQGLTRPEIAMAVHQCAIFCKYPRLVQVRAIRYIAKYLVRTSIYVDLPNRNQQLTTRGAVYRNNIEKGIECYLDANFAS